MSPLQKLKAARLLVGAALGICVCFSGAAQSYPLPPWYFYSGGTAANGTWTGSSTAPDNVTLSVTIGYPPQPPGTYKAAIASSSSGLLVIAPRATYTLTFAAFVNGLGYANSLFAGDGATITGISMQGVGWKNYTNSFTTAGTSDSNVGQELHALFSLTSQGSSPGSTTATFTNIQLKVNAPRPSLAIQNVGAGQLQLRWSTNFDWCAPETAEDVLASIWDSVNTPRTVQGNQFVVPVALEAGPRFFRLRVQ